MNRAEAKEDAASRFVQMIGYEDSVMVKRISEAVRYGFDKGVQFTDSDKAKEIIRELLGIIDYLNEDEYGKEDFPAVHKAKAFLKEQNYV